MVQMFFWRTSSGAEVDLLLEKDKKPIAAIEIKYSENISSSHLSGLRSFLDDHPDVPCYLISRVSHAWSAGPVTILPWQRYLELLPEIIS